MKTEGEIQKLKDVEKTITEFFGLMKVQVDGQDVPPDIEAGLIGIPMACIDALFAIRDGEPWRGLNSPEFIARKILQEMNIGE